MSKKTQYRQGFRGYREQNVTAITEQAKDILGHAAVAGLIGGKALPDKLGYDFDT